MRLRTLILVLFATSCTQRGGAGNSSEKIPVRAGAVLPDENPYPRVGSVPLPEGFTRVVADSNSFTTWLRGLSLKKDKTVYLYNGQPKYNQSAQYAVLDVPVGRQDLQQCADAVMRLRAEYYFAQRRYEKISFGDNSGRTYLFTPPYTRAHFDQYLLRVFGSCGSASLEKQLQPRHWAALSAGDVLIRGGFPGHAVMVMDVAVNGNGDTVYLLAQSYMPAQDIHLLLNPREEGSPWYRVDSSHTIITPEWRFAPGALKTW